MFVHTYACRHIITYKGIQTYSPKKFLNGKYFLTHSLNEKILTLSTGS